MRGRLFRGKPRKSMDWSRKGMAIIADDQGLHRAGPGASRQSSVNR
jgi:hypothetical protein